MKKKEKELRDEYIPAEIVSDDELDGLSINDNYFEDQQG